MKRAFSHPLDKIDFLILILFRADFFIFFLFIMASGQILRGTVFLDGCWLRNKSAGFYNCHEKSCPFRVRLSFSREGGVQHATVDKILFSVHCHAFKDRSKKANKDLITQELAVIKRGLPGSEELLEKHHQWLKEAKKESKELIKSLNLKDGFDKYATKHPEATGSQLASNIGKKMSPEAASMARRRALKKAGKATNVKELLLTREHHLLANDGEDVLVFGDKTTVSYMSTVNLILADGTFRCLLPGYSQLYVFHVVVANNVAVPALFCLVKGKKKQTYKKVLRLIEGIAESNGTVFFNRPVTVMSDFEAAFIKAVQELYGSVTVRCCLFHFTQNIRKAATPIITKVKNAAGEKSETVRMAKRKRRFMMLPLLPEEVNKPEVVRLIVDDWKGIAPDDLKDAFDDLASTVLKTYVGTPPEDPRPRRPRSPRLSGVSAGKASGPTTARRAATRSSTPRPRSCSPSTGSWPSSRARWRRPVSASQLGVSPSRAALSRRRTGLSRSSWTTLSLDGKARSSSWTTAG